MKKKVINPVLWSPSDERVKSSQIFKFIKIINEKNNVNIQNFTDLHTWSIENKADFWSAIWDFFNVIGSKGMKPYINPINKMPGSKFFPNGKVNYAENMLSGDTSGPAIVFKSEDKIRKELSWKELKGQVAALANFLKTQGVVKGDRVAAYMPNMPQTVIIMLATGPLPISIFDSKTMPVAFESKSVFKSNISAWRIIASINLSMFNFVFAEISTIKVSPDRSSEINSCSSN